MYFFGCRLDVRRVVNLLEREVFESKPIIEDLVFNLYDVFFKGWVFDRSCSIHFFISEVIQTLGYTLESGWFVFRAVGRDAYPGYQSDQYFAICCRLDNRYVPVIGSTAFNSYPLMITQLLIFCLVILKNYRHLFSWHENELVEDKAKSTASLPNADLFEGFDINVAFIRITRSDR